MCIHVGFPGARVRCARCSARVAARDARKLRARHDHHGEASWSSTTECARSAAGRSVGVGHEDATDIGSASEVGLGASWPRGLNGSSPRTLKTSITTKRPLLLFMAFSGAYISLQAHRCTRHRCICIDVLDGCLTGAHASTHARPAAARASRVRWTRTYFSPETFF